VQFYVCLLVCKRGLARVARFGITLSWSHRSPALPPFGSSLLHTMNQEHPLSDYIYQSLQCPDDIRILVLLPAAHLRAPIEAQLVHQNRENIIRGHAEPSHYEAVSYCWGDALFSHYLTCDGEAIAITRNVDLMLRRLRKPLKPRYLWVDAICLNQKDMAEKAVRRSLLRATGW
jgi:hypothetical protein